MFPLSGFDFLLDLLAIGVYVAVVDIAAVARLLIRLCAQSVDSLVNPLVGRLLSLSVDWFVGRSVDFGQLVGVFFEYERL